MNTQPDRNAVISQMGLVIVAAGRGQRAGLSHGPKQYHKLGDKTVIAHTLAAFANLPADQICIVHHQDDEALLAEAIGAQTLKSVLRTAGGPTRQASVHEGLKTLKRNKSALTHVMIHDAARPFVSQHLLDRIYGAVSNHPEDGILPTLAIAETVKRIDAEHVDTTVSRENLMLAQTPQTFPLNTILALHEQAAERSDHSFTDDASIFEWANQAVRVIDGDKGNVKLTYAADFKEAEERMMMQENATSALPDVRTGNGYDVHVFGPGNEVWLCGVSIPHDKTLSGHSDADVGLHALTDALLATCGAGDIGDHFPPTDPKWKGAPSHIFLEHAAKIVREHGGTIMNADVSIIAEAPKIAPLREAMCQKLSDLLDIERQRCSVKATTNERMGFVGREEGIAAIATASVVFGPKR